MSSSKEIFLGTAPDLPLKWKRGGQSPSGQYRGSNPSGREDILKVKGQPWTLPRQKPSAFTHRCSLQAAGSADSLGYHTHTQAMLVRQAGECCRTTQRQQVSLREEHSPPEPQIKGNAPQQVTWDQGQHGPGRVSTWRTAAMQQSGVAVRSCTSTSPPRRQNLKKTGSFYLPICLPALSLSAL